MDVAPEEPPLEPIELGNAAFGEVVNGRLGMMGFVAGLAAEQATPFNVESQFEFGSVYVLVWAAALATASYTIPELLNGKPLGEALASAGEGAVESEAPGAQPRPAIRFPGEYGALYEVERANGRAAMIGFTLLAGSELLRGKGFEELRWLEQYVSLNASDWGAALLDVKSRLVENHLSWIEDAYLTLLTGTTFFAAGQLVGVKRKSRSIGATVHTWTGAAQFAVCLYPVFLERLYREVPGWEWQWLALGLAMANCLTVGPLMKYYKGPAVYGKLFALGYDFVISFQGIQLIAWANRPDAPDWMYWAVMPFWYWSVQKLLTSAKYVTALLPEEKLAETPLQGWGEKCRAELSGIALDVPTVAYTGLNTAAALFDNAWMFLFTVRGAEGFWAFSNKFAPYDAELSLIKPAVGSLTVTVVVFLGTLAARRKIPASLAGGLNVVLGSVGPWIILWWHVICYGEPWFPQFQAIPVV